VDAATRVLVLANPTADSIEPRQQLLARHGQGPIAVTVLAPQSGRFRTRTGAQSLRGGDRGRRRSALQAGGIKVSCVIGDPDPMTAFEREWQRGRYDEIIVSTLPR
jgi:hypothetical protein